MIAREAMRLEIGAVIEWNDGRTATVEENNSTEGTIRMKFADDSIGINRYADMGPAELAGPMPRGSSPSQADFDALAMRVTALEQKVQ